MTRSWRLSVAPNRGSPTPLQLRGAGDGDTLFFLETQFGWLSGLGKRALPRRTPRRGEGHVPHRRRLLLDLTYPAQHRALAAARFADRDARARALTLFGALPMYAASRPRSPHGRGASSSSRGCFRWKAKSSCSASWALPRPICDRHPRCRRPTPAHLISTLTVMVDRPIVVTLLLLRRSGHFPQGVSPKLIVLAGAGGIYVALNARHHR